LFRIKKRLSADGTWGHRIIFASRLIGPSVSAAIYAGRSFPSFGDSIQIENKKLFVLNFKQFNVYIEMKKKTFSIKSLLF